MALLVDIPRDTFSRVNSHGIFDDFYAYVSADEWTLVASDSGTATKLDQAGGVLAVNASDGTVADNDESYLKGVNEFFLFAAGKPLIAECRLQFTDTGTPADDMNVIFGLMNAVAADHLLDNGGGPAASFSGAVFFKVDGETVWRVRNSIGTGATSSLSTVTAGGAAFQTLRIECNPITSTLQDIMFYVNGSLVAKHKDQTMASATEMQLVAGVKAGAATNAAIINLDYIWAYQTR